ncbi:MAG: Modification methylase DpnIIB [Alphaproteobacteria bacterium MarineAlpha5_Bin9]|nr:MAG: Modification methylase DpnIIB [Alphaproteobacteria bacterium MarineAlpha5_Bin9]|tara:strand:- start:3207 stop:4001 length:795 start_codon:yes stop_codon:yes gene_type:complete
MKKEYYKNSKNKIKLYQGDSIKILDELIKSKKIKFDCIFADPPYFLSNGGVSVKNGKRVSVNKGYWDKSKGIEKNFNFNLKWLSKCQKLLTNNGTIWISGTFHIIYSIAYIAEKLDMKFLNNIVWQKPNPPPNLSCRYFTHSTETILWLAKNKKSKHQFNYNYTKNINKNKQMKDVWTISSPKKIEKQFGKHPTQKPYKLLDIILNTSTSEGDYILDPFNGSGTTGVVSALKNRRYIGIEKEKKYCDLSIKNFENLERYPSSSK